jgi:hypothetical protein
VLSKLFDIYGRNLGNSFRVKNCLFLAEEFLRVFKFEILVSSNWQLMIKTYYIKKHFIFWKKVNIFMGLFFISYDQKFSSHWTEKKFAANKTTKYPFRIHLIVKPHLNKPCATPHQFILVTFAKLLPLSSLPKQVFHVSL